ncbi:PREDICTED: B-cell CLL/lymphoma 9-like protein [Branchiostoma belcheri]|uniref:B-cell CLL/lymphoma 9-like protein n=1 Tax=Branchiostoma belcheri TaxID=7741 RepID=A0A6P4XWQ1_BRABE|nr:PREDICTED: B-cell CLL/lymphoma 9-like protein [Branchiostoma belcheri]
MEPGKPEARVDLRGAWELVQVAQFLRLFRQKFGFADINTQRLEAELRQRESVPVADTLARLLRYLLSRSDIRLGSWEADVKRVLAETGGQWKPFATGAAYADMDPYQRLVFLKGVADHVFEEKVEELSEYLDETYDPEDMRAVPIGQDSLKHTYWYFDDLRLYKESVGRKGEKWECICSSLKEWTSFVKKFRKTTHPQEKELYEFLHGQLLPLILGPLQTLEGFTQDADRRRFETAEFLRREEEEVNQVSRLSRHDSSNNISRHRGPLAVPSSTATSAASVAPPENAAETQLPDLKQNSGKAEPLEREPDLTGSNQFRTDPTKDGTGPKPDRTSPKLDRTGPSQDVVTSPNPTTSPNQDKTGPNQLRTSSSQSQEDTAGSDWSSADLPPVKPSGKKRKRETSTDSRDSSGTGQSDTSKGDARTPELMGPPPAPPPSSLPPVADAPPLQNPPVKKQQQYAYIFSTELANKAAEAVLQGRVQSIVAFHIEYVTRLRLSRMRHSEQVQSGNPWQQLQASQLGYDPGLGLTPSTLPPQALPSKPPPPYPGSATAEAGGYPGGSTGRPGMPPRGPAGLNMQQQQQPSPGNLPTNPMMSPHGLMTSQANMMTSQAGWSGDPSQGAPPHKATAAAMLGHLGSSPVGSEGMVSPGSDQMSAAQMEWRRLEESFYREKRKRMLEQQMMRGQPYGGQRYPGPQQFLPQDYDGPPDSQGALQQTMQPPPPYQDMARSIQRQQTGLSTSYGEPYAHQLLQSQPQPQGAPQDRHQLLQSQPQPQGAGGSGPEGLTPEQLRHRQERLLTIQRMHKMLFPEQAQTAPPSDSLAQQQQIDLASLQGRPGMPPRGPAGINMQQQQQPSPGNLPTNPMMSPHGLMTSQANMMTSQAGWSGDPSQGAPAHKATAAAMLGHLGSSPVGSEGMVSPGSDQMSAAQMEWRRLEESFYREKRKRMLEQQMMRGQPYGGQRYPGPQQFLPQDYDGPPDSQGALQQTMQPPPPYQDMARSIQRQQTGFSTSYGEPYAHQLLQSQSQPQGAPQDRHQLLQSQPQPQGAPQMLQSQPQPQGAPQMLQSQPQPQGAPQMLQSQPQPQGRFRTDTSSCSPSHRGRPSCCSPNNSHRGRPRTDTHYCSHSHRGRHRCCSPNNSHRGRPSCCSPNNSHRGRPRTDTHYCSHSHRGRRRCCSPSHSHRGRPRKVPPQTSVLVSSCRRGHDCRHSENSCRSTQLAKAPVTQPVTQDHTQPDTQPVTQVDTQVVTQAVTHTASCTPCRTALDPRFPHPNSRPCRD